MVRDNDDACLTNFLECWRRDQYAGDRLINIYTRTYEDYKKLIACARVHIRIVNQLSCRGWLIALALSDNARFSYRDSVSASAFLFRRGRFLMEKPHRDPPLIPGCCYIYRCYSYSSRRQRRDRHSRHNNYPSMWFQLCVKVVQKQYKINCTAKSMYNHMILRCETNIKAT